MRVGEIYPSKYGDMQVILYENSKKVTVEFIETGYTLTTRADRIRTGVVWDKTKPRLKEVPTPKDFKIGEIFSTKSFGKLEVVSFKSALEVKVKFQDTGSVICARAEHIRNGQVRDPYKPTVYGVGIVGNVKTKFDGKNTQVYNTWYNMLSRGYCKRLHQKYPSYTDVSVCEDWLYLEKFKTWFDENYQEGYHLDKDLLVKGNRVYSPETSIFIPQRLNGLLIQNKSLRVDDLPLGISFNKSSGKYISRCHEGNCQPTILGYFDNPKAAFKIYKEFKEDLVKSLAEEYYSSGQITELAYNALLKFEVTEED